MVLEMDKNSVRIKVVGRLIIAPAVLVHLGFLLSETWYVCSGSPFSCLAVIDSSTFLPLQKGKYRLVVFLESIRNYAGLTEFSTKY